MLSQDCKMALSADNVPFRRSFSLPSASVRVLESEPGLSIATRESSVEIWDHLCREFNDKREQIEKYKISKLKECDFYLNPTVQYLEETVFPLLNEALIKMLEKAKEEDCLLRQKTTFNGIDYLSEYLWNMNPRYKERRENWTYIFDMDWVKEFLKDKPRPHYPFSLIWSRNYAAIKIQAFMRGYWVRRREDVQEVRQFWKIVDSPWKKERIPSLIQSNTLQSELLYDRKVNISEIL